ncbi:DNA polymerase III subunit delta [Sneathiella aquimaris]|uniref:DNA polymerase III subunit delta n=1 Tax=Sneathiella aquimaris TaxID=2599305 RepID=UPI00146B773C|nr:DNA polymerase III subunit delta [Sneathiella aquimaris]
MVEFKAPQLASYLKSPNKSYRIFLVYGQDEGLVRERSKAICQTVIPDLNDPFCYSEIPASSLSEDPGKLIDEINAISMMGGERVVRVRNAGNSTTTVIKTAFDADYSNTVLVIEAGEIRKDSALVKAVSKEKNGVVIPCFRDKAQDISALITEVFSKAGLSAESGVVDYLRQSLGSDRSISRQELDKLVLYKGKDTSPITLNEAQTMVGDSSAESVFDVIDAALMGNLDHLEKSLNKAFFSGESPITFLRLIQNQLKQLHKAASFIDMGISASEALKKSGIPFFNHQKVSAQLSRKNSQHFATCLSLILQAEMDCKTTGYPDETLCRRALLRVAIANRKR